MKRRIYEKKIFFDLLEKYKGVSVFFENS